MPIYEFICGECNERFEELVRPGTESIPCPSCGKRDHVKRILSVCGFTVEGGRSAGSGTSSSTSSACSTCSSTACSTCGISSR